MENAGSEIRSFQRGYLVAERYLVDSQLGSGGMGAVYKVLDTKLDNEAIALKILYPHHVKDAVTLARFRNEVLVARKLNHPNVTRIFDFGEGEAGSVFITMEYVEGRSFGEYIYAPRHERMIFGEIVEVLYDVASGMNHAHRMGVIHRDLKPDNILISNSKEIKITDFGLARNMEIDKRFTQTGEAVGTPYYMAPEQLRGLKLDSRCDVYAFGIIAFEAASGQRPFQDETYLNLAALHLKGEVPSICRVQPGIPEWFE